MTNEKEKLLELLRKDPLLYREEIGLLSEDFPMPEFMRRSVQVREIAENSFALRYLHFQRIHEYLLSFDGNKSAILQYLEEAYTAENAPALVLSNIEVGKAQLESPNHTYAADAAEIRPLRSALEGLQIRRLASSEGELLAQLKEEIDGSGFTPYSFLQEMIANGSADVHLALLHEQPIAFVHMGKTATLHGKSVAEPALILTTAAYRGKGVAAELLSRVLLSDYRDCTILYHANAENLASCRTAEKIGLRYLGSHYFYSPEIFISVK